MHEPADCFLCPTRHVKHELLLEMQYVPVFAVHPAVPQVQSCELRLVPLTSGQTGRRQTLKPEPASLQLDVHRTRLPAVTDLPCGVEYLSELPFILK